jgi:hypothetical protein
MNLCILMKILTTVGVSWKCTCRLIGKCSEEELEAGEFELYDTIIMLSSVRNREGFETITFVVVV